MKKNRPKKRDPGGIVLGDNVTIRGNMITGEVKGNVSYENTEIKVEDGGITEKELAQIQLLFQPLQSKILNSDLPEGKKLLAREYAEQLEKELTHQDEQPDESLIKVAGNWLLTNIPEIAGTLTEIFVNPLVGKVVRKAGKVTSEWVHKRFGPQ